MRSVLRQLRAAPARVAATIASLALALAALGVFAVPGVSTATLHDAAEQDRLAHVTAPVTPLEDVAELAAIPSVTEVEGRIEQTVRLESAETAPLVGLDFETQAINLVAIETGRLPTAPFEAVADSDIAALGDQIDVDSGTLTVVGTGSTAARADEPSLYVDEATATAVTGVTAPNLVLLRLDETDDAALDAAVADLRGVVALDGGSLTAFPETRAEGTHPIDEDLTTISMMIGGLGVVAGVVALILLASTTNTLITERTREAAVMRSLGSSRRPLRRRLRRVAMAMAMGGAIIGIPLGIAVSNIIARMVLVEFVGITPGLAVAWPVVIGSAVFAIVGARLAAGHAARRVTRIPLAEALRDHDGAPFGRRWSDRVLAKLPTGGLLGRVGIRNTSRRRARSFGVMAQAGAGVAAAVIVGSMYTSIASFDEAEVRSLGVGDDGPVPPIPAIPMPRQSVTPTPLWKPLCTPMPSSESGKSRSSVSNPPPSCSTAASNPAPGSARPAGALPVRKRPSSLPDSRRSRASRSATTSKSSWSPARPASRSSGPTVTGRGRSSWSVTSWPKPSTLPAAANIVWTTGSPPTQTLSGGVSDTVGQAQAAAADRAARAAVLYIFTAIGVVVVAVAALSLSSTMLVNLHERRHELAALRSVGGRRSQLRRLLAIETVPLVLAGWLVGLAAGWAGSAALIAMFEAADAVEIGFVFATAAIPLTAVAVTLVAVLLSHLATRTSARQSPAAVLRTTA